MSGMMQQGRDGKWMDYSSGMGQYKPNYQPPAAKAINPANDPLTDANYLGGSQPWWEQKAQPAAPKLNSMQTSGLYRGGLGTYTGNVAGQVQGLMNPNAATHGAGGPQYGAGGASGFGQMMDSQRNQIADLRKLAQRDDYAQGGQAHTFALNSAYSRPSNMLQNALQNTQRSAAERGITLGSGLTQGMLNTNRNDAAKMAAASAGQVDQDFAVRQAEQQERNRNYLSELTNMEARIGSQGFNDQLAGLRLGMQQDEMMYNRNTFDPLKVQGLSLQNEGAMLGNQYQRNTNQYQPQMLQQGLTRGQQQIDQGGLDLNFNRATYDPRVQAANAGYGYEAANYGGLTDMTNDERQFYNSGEGQFQRSYSRYQNNPIVRTGNQIANAPFEVMKVAAPFASRMLTGGAGG